MFVFALEGKQLKLEIWFTLLLGLLNWNLVAPCLSLLQQLLLKLIVAHLEVGNEPVDDVLEGDVSDYAFQGLASEVNFAGRTLCSLLVLAEEGIDASLAVSAHAFVDRVSVAVDSFAEEAGQVLEHVSLGGATLSQGGHVRNVW